MGRGGPPGPAPPQAKRWLEWATRHVRRRRADVGRRRLVVLKGFDGEVHTALRRFLFCLGLTAWDAHDRAAGTRQQQIEPVHLQLQAGCNAFRHGVEEGGEEWISTEQS